MTTRPPTSFQVACMRAFLADPGQQGDNRRQRAGRRWAGHLRASRAEPDSTATTGAPVPADGGPAR